MRKLNDSPSIGRRKIILGGAMALANATIGLSHVAAQSSDGPMKIAGGFPPGGSGDLFARSLADGLREEQAER